jgi:hypothetical protein
VDANGPEFIFHINHEPVARLSDPDYVSGEVGFFVENFEESLAHVHFDALTIRETDAEPVEITSNVLYADDFSDPASGWPEEDEAGAPYRVGYHPPDFYHLEPRAAEERLAISLVDEYGDVTVETDAFIDHTDTDGGDFRYGLLLRRVAEDQYWKFCNKVLRTRCRALPRLALRRINRTEFAWTPTDRILPSVSMVNESLKLLTKTIPGVRSAFMPRISTNP